MNACFRLFSTLTSVVACLVFITVSPSCFAQDSNLKLQKSFEQIKMAAEKNDADAQYHLGDCYYNGVYVAVDYDQALQWIRRAVEQGNTSASKLLGDCYLSGRGVEKDIEEGIRWMRKSASEGNADAQLLLGAHFNYGIIIKSNKAESDKWMSECIKTYKIAAARGNASAQSALGDLYLFGEGITSDKDLSASWLSLYTAQLRRSADQGQGYAQLRLGRCYLENRGVERDLAEARKWYEKAAEHNEPKLKSDAMAGLRNVELYPARRTATIRAWIAMQKADSEARRTDDPLDQVAKAALLYSEIDLDDVDKELTSYIETCLVAYKNIRTVLVRVKQDKQQLLQDRRNARELAVLVGVIFGRALNEKDPNAGAAGGALLGELAAAGLSQTAIENLKANYTEVFNNIEGWDKLRSRMRRLLRLHLQMVYSSKFLDAIE